MGQGQNLKSIAKRAAEVAWEYHHAKEELSQMKKDFETQKAEFEEVMLEYSDALGHKKKVSFEDDGFSDGASLVVNRVEKTSIEWDADKLAKRVEKRIAKQIIKKQYRITDMQGLVEYLKECGVDPKIFKKYLIVEQTVDEKAIDRLGDIGELSVKAISGCYMVKSQKPYFTTSVKKDDGDGE